MAVKRGRRYTPTIEDFVQVGLSRVGLEAEVDRAIAAAWSEGLSGFDVFFGDPAELVAR